MVAPALDVERSKIEATCARVTEKEVADLVDDVWVDLLRRLCQQAART